MAATDSSDNHACLSSTGADLEVSAPRVSVNSAQLYGGKTNKRDLRTTVRILDNLDDPVAGARVSINLTTTSGRSWSSTGYTATDGRVGFTLKSAPSACYHTQVTSVNSVGLTWNGVTPANNFCK